SAAIFLVFPVWWFPPQQLMSLTNMLARAPSPPVLLRVPGRPGRLYSGGFSGFSMLIRPPFPEAGFGLPLHVRCLEENASDLQQLNTPHKDRLDKRSSALELN
uniref:Uncharacterized protein n=1 Tax=Oryzias latipes TaxID=8090 RepID=A0A3B3HNI6_ORYLA